MSVRCALWRMANTMLSLRNSKGLHKSKKLRKRAIALATLWDRTNFSGN